MQDKAIPLGRLIHLVNQQKDRLLSQVFEDIDITAAQFKVLAVLGFESCSPTMMHANSLHKQSESYGGALSPASICQHLSLDAGAMTRMLKRLMDKNLIKKVPNPDDKRSVLVELTKVGFELYLDCKEKIDLEFNVRFTDKLSDQEVETLAQLLIRLLPDDSPCLGIERLPKV